MPASLGRIVIVFALVLSTGAQWAFLQGVAWTSMLAENLTHGSLAQSLETTFDGEHPCALCKVIAAAKKTDSKNEVAKVKSEIKFPPCPWAALPDVPDPITAFSLAPQFAVALTAPPALPPPRGLTV